VGEATLSIYPTFFGSLQPFVNDLITRKVVPIDGNAYFEFDIENELHLKQDYERQYLLDALVEEKSTGSQLLHFEVGLNKSLPKDLYST